MNLKVQKAEKEGVQIVITLSQLAAEERLLLLDKEITAMERQISFMQQKADSFKQEKAGLETVIGKTAQQLNTERKEALEALQAAKLAEAREQLKG